MNWKNYLRPTLCGAAAGFVNGFFGAGGGMVLVPLLIRLGKMEDKKAFSSSVCIYLIGGAGGGVLAGLLFRKVPARALHLTLGALILLGGVRLLLC